VFAPVKGRPAVCFRRVFVGAGTPAWVG